MRAFGTRSSISKTPLSVNYRKTIANTQNIHEETTNLGALITSQISHPHPMLPWDHKRMSLSHGLDVQEGQHIFSRVYHLGRQTRTIIGRECFGEFVGLCEWIGGWIGERYGAEWTIITAAGVGA